MPQRRNSEMVDNLKPDFLGRNEYIGADYIAKYWDIDAGHVHDFPTQNVSVGDYSTKLGDPLGTGNTRMGYFAGNSYTAGAVDNVSIGRRAGGGISTSVMSGDYNTCVGSWAGEELTTGIANTLLGFRAGQTVTSGQYNVFVGYQSGQNSSGGTRNIMIGSFTGGNTASQANCVFLGYAAGSGATGNNNTLVGYSAGSAFVTNTNCVALGYQAGQFESGSNRLHINAGGGTSSANSASEVPLIWGDFTNKQVGFYANLNYNTITGQGVIAIGNATSAPGSNPTNGGILYVNAGALTYRGSSGTVTVIAAA